MPGLDQAVATGTPESPRAGGRIRAAASALLAHAEAEQWLRPAISYALWPIAATHSDGMELAGGVRLRSVQAAHRLRGAAWLAAGVCTLGGRLERQVRASFSAGEHLQAVLLDEIGTRALFRLADDLEAQLRREARQLGFMASGVLNPGEPGFSLREQRTVMELAGAARIGVSATTEGVMSPGKTLTLIMGLGEAMPFWGRGESCARCRAQPRCTLRRAAADARVA